MHLLFQYFKLLCNLDIPLTNTLDICEYISLLAVLLETIHSLGFSLIVFGFPKNTATLEIYFHLSLMKCGVSTKNTLRQHTVKVKL